LFLSKKLDIGCVEEQDIVFVSKEEGVLGGCCWAVATTSVSEAHNEIYFANGGKVRYVASRWGGIRSFESADKDLVWS
jgi:hypothetical protein